MKSFSGRVSLGAAVAALCVLSVEAWAEGPAASPANSRATLTVTYELKGKGVDRPASHEKNVTWTVEDRYEVVATMTAQKPSGFPAMHKLDAAEQAREADRQAAANAAAQNMKPMMEQVQDIMKLCGEDEACITRETMKMAQGIDPNSSQMQSAKSNIAKVGVMPDVRYQLFNPGTQSATFAIKEAAHEAYFDAACSLATEERCAYDTAVNGKGDIIGSNGAKVFPSGAAAEIDFQAGSLLLHLTDPGPVEVKKIVTSKSPDAPTGTSAVMRAIRYSDIGESVEVPCGACNTASGKFEKEISDQLLGRPAKLVVTWSFKRS